MEEYGQAASSSIITAMAGVGLGALIEGATSDFAEGTADVDNFVSLCSQLILNGVGITLARDLFFQ